jgi:hypothetical protein
VSHLDHSRAFFDALVMTCRGPSRTPGKKQFPAIRVALVLLPSFHLSYLSLFLRRQIQPGLGAAILDRSVAKPARYLSLVKPGDGEEYDETNFQARREGRGAHLTHPAHPAHTQHTAHKHTHTNMSPKKKQQHRRALTEAQRAERVCSICEVPVPGAFTWLDPDTQQPRYGSLGEAERAVGQPKSRWAQGVTRTLLCLGWDPHCVAWVKGSQLRRKLTATLASAPSLLTRTRAWRSSDSSCCRRSASPLRTRWPPCTRCESWTSCLRFDLN